MSTAIDCPELDTAEGKRAKRFVESELSQVPYVVISSTKSDKFDRYLADVFYPPPSLRAKRSNPESENLIFLNNRLLQERLAVRMS